RHLDVGLTMHRFVEHFSESLDERRSLSGSRHRPSPVAMASYPVSLNEDDLPRTYLADLEERRVGGDQVSEAKVSCQHRRVDRDGPRRVCPERGDLGRERHAAAFVMIEEGPLTGSISSEKEFAIRWIPEREREHSGKSLDKPFSEFEVETWNHRDVRCRGH